MSELFKLKKTKYKLRIAISLQSINTRTTSYGIDSVSHLAPKIWSQIPTEIRNCKTLITFKNLIKTWTPKSCPCRYMFATWVLFKAFPSRHSNVF